LKMIRTRYGSYYGDIESSYATLYNVGRYIPGNHHITDAFDLVLTPSYKEMWPELEREMHNKAEKAINSWLKQEVPETVIKTLRPLQNTPKLRSVLTMLKALALPKYRFYFDSDWKAIPRDFATPTPFFVLPNTVDFVRLTETKIIRYGEITLEIDGLVLKAEDCQLLFALKLLMRERVTKISEAGVHFTTSLVEIAKMMRKSNPWANSTQRGIIDGLKRLRGCVLTLKNEKGQWMIGGILNKATKLNGQEIRIILDKDYIELLDISYVGLNPDVYLKLSPIESNLYKYLMR